MKPGLLETKLFLPSPPPKRVERSRLVARLNEGLAAGRALTLISAPAGFGKTTCASEWVHLLDRPVSWLSLEPADDDPGRFFHYFVAALQRADPSLGLEAEEVLSAPAGQRPPLESLATILLNDISKSDREFVLVLDDFQVIQDSAILKTLEKVLNNATREHAPRPGDPRRSSASAGATPGQQRDDGDPRRRFAFHAGGGGPFFEWTDGSGARRRRRRRAGRSD
ncbi:MAG: hypothetical protein M1482_00890 [Chloroflexi bacterium]|nr:hypothetical protein [Chloroflexota bacterium]